MAVSLFCFLIAVHDPTPFLKPRSQKLEWNWDAWLVSGQGTCVEAQQNPKPGQAHWLTFWAPAHCDNTLAFLMCQYKTPDFFRHRQSGRPPQPCIPLLQYACPPCPAPTLGQEPRVKSLEKGRCWLCSSKAEKTGSGCCRWSQQGHKGGHAPWGQHCGIQAAACLCGCSVSPPF